jgi:hypothetical protein
MKFIYSLLFSVIFSSCYAQQSTEINKSTDSLRVLIFVQFLVTKEGEIKKIKVPRVEGDKILKSSLKLLKTTAINEVLKIKDFDPSDVNQLYRMPFSFVFPSDYDFSKLNQ